MLTLLLFPLTVFAVPATACMKEWFERSHLFPFLLSWVKPSESDFDFATSSQNTVLSLMRVLTACLAMFSIVSNVSFACLDPLDMMWIFDLG